MKRKNIVSLLVVLTLCAGLITGCNASGTQNPETTQSTQKSTAEITVAPSAGAEDPLAAYEPDESVKYEITCTFPGPNPVVEDAEMLLYFENLFNVDFQVWNLDQSNYVELLNLKISGGEIPDLIVFTGQASMVQDYYDQGILLTLDRAVLDKYSPDLMVQLDSQVPGWETYCTYDGNLVHLPDFEQEPNEQAIIWRGDWLENVGITKTPDTLDEWEDALYAFTFNDPDGNGIPDTYGASLMVLQPVFGAFGAIPYWSFGYEKDFGNVWHAKDGELVYAGIQPEMKEALAVLRKWYQDGVLDPEFVTGENQGDYWAYTQPFFNGRIGYTGHGAIYHWIPPLYEGDLGGKDYQEFYKINPEAAESLVYGDPPIGPNGDRGVSGVSKISQDKGLGFSSRLSDKPDKFGKLLEILNYGYESYENNTLVDYGIKDKDYTVKTVQGYDGKTYDMNIVADWVQEIGDSNSVFLGALTIIPAYFEDHASNPSLEWKLSHNIGEDVYTNDLTVTLPCEETYGTELEKLTSETYYQIIMGEKPLDYFDEYVASWLANGGEEMQREANEWYAAIPK